MNWVSSTVNSGTREWIKMKDYWPQKERHPKFWEPSEMGKSTRKQLWTTDLHTCWDLSFPEQNVHPTSAGALSPNYQTERGIAVQAAILPSAHV